MNSEKTNLRDEVLDQLGVTIDSEHYHTVIRAFEAGVKLTMQAFEICGKTVQQQLL